MRMRNQLIVIAAVLFATIAVAVSVFAGVRAMDRQAQNPPTPIPISDTLDTTSLPRPLDTGEPNRTAAGEPAARQPGAPSEPSATEDVAADNHGRAVSTFTMQIGHLDRAGGQPGAIVRSYARPNVGSNGPPRAARAEERRNTSGRSPSKDRTGG